MTPGELLAEELRHAVHGDAWHGPSLREAVAGITAEEAMQRPIPAAHSIWELVLHITSWSNIGLRRIKGAQPEPYVGEDWRLPPEFSESHWKEAVAEMVASHEELCDVVAGLTNEELERNAPGSERSIAFMLHGIAQHDAYHGGQISLLRKAITRQHRRAAL